MQRRIYLRPTPRKPLCSHKGFCYTKCMTKREAAKLTETDTCPICKNKSMMICPPELHVATLNSEGNGCGNCDGEADTPEHVMCICQDA